MSDHKFKIGQVVYFRPPPVRGIGAPANQRYRITQLLPAERGRAQIRCEETERRSGYSAAKRRDYLDQMER
jgi:hypothetical protein